jgi:hypothetical protein
MTMMMMLYVTCIAPMILQVFTVGSLQDCGVRQCIAHAERAYMNHDMTRNIIV